MTGPIYVECSDGRVLAEHQRDGDVQVIAEVPGGWLTRGIGMRPSCTAAASFSAWVASGSRFRLVFEDAAAAGRGLADYALRLGADVVEVRPDGSSASVCVPCREYAYTACLEATPPVTFRIAAPEEPPSPQPDEGRYCHAEVWSEGGYSSSLCMKPVGTCAHTPEPDDPPRTKPEWRGWPGYLGRAIGAVTENDGETSKEARARLMEVYDEWVAAGRPDHDPASVTAIVFVTVLAEGGES